MAKFHGEIENLKQVVQETGKIGQWSFNEKGNVHSFKTQTGEILNWWPSTGTLNSQNCSGHQNFLELIISKLDKPADPSSSIVTNQTDKKAKIFIVHGHDKSARDQLELVLIHLGLNPFILQNSTGEGKTIIEALEQKIIKETAFGIVLLTPDDFGYTKDETEADRKPRARQNVILEMGMVMTALGRNRVAILQKGTLERPSDTDGILRIEFNNEVKEIVPKLAQHLSLAGFQISSEAIMKASA